MIPYRIQRLLKRLAVITLIILAVLALLILCWFLWLDRYVVYTRDGAMLDFEKTSEEIVGQAATPPANDNLIPIYYNEGDNTVETSKELGKMSGYYIDTAALTAGIDTVIAQVKTLSPGTPVLLEVKNSFGSFYYNTNASNFRTDNLDRSKVDELIRVMNQKDLYTIACLPALRDYSFGLNHEQNGLPTAGGYLWADEEYRYWLDPTNDQVVGRLIQIATELRNLGFDEVVFDEFRFPDTNRIVFNKDKTQAITDAAKTLVDACASDRFCVSFIGTDAAFPLPEGHARLYLTGVNAADINSVIDQVQTDDPDIHLLFMTAVYDTRFDKYSVLRPLNTAH